MGHARFTYRARVSVTAERALLCEWGRCRWVWNQCVAESRQAWKEKRECGPAGLDKILAVGAEKARAVAAPSLAEAYEKVGFLRPAL